MINLNWWKDCEKSLSFFLGCCPGTRQFENKRTLEPKSWARWHRRKDRASNGGSFIWCTCRYLTTKARVKSDSRWPTGSPNLHCFKQWDWSLDYHRNSCHFHRFCLQSDPRIRIWPKPFLSPIGTCIRCAEPQSWGNWSSGVNAPTNFP